MKAGSYSIKWRYTPTKQITQCQILDDNGIIGEGQALLAHTDRFCKNTGRKISLARAMFDADIPKTERIVFWELYRNMKIGGRW
jgi:hypothetical protein